MPHDRAKPLYDTILGQMAYASVRIETADESGNITGCGTGFIFQFELGDMKLPLIITARHVVQSAAQVRLQLHEQDSAGSLRRGLFLSELEAVEDVYMVGYPAGLFDAHNNLPIVRRGITATPVALDYEGRHEFLVDMAVYSGSSGSPIFINKVSNFVNADGQLQENARMRLLGVLCEGHHITETGEIVADGSSSPSLVAIPQMINLGICLKAEVVLGFEAVLRSGNIERAPWETDPAPLPSGVSR